eukprot:3368378-Rhodomonas_salina.1
MAYRRRVAAPICLRPRYALSSTEAEEEEEEEGQGGGGGREGGGREGGGGEGGGGEGGGGEGGGGGEHLPMIYLPPCYALAISCRLCLLPPHYALPGTDKALDGTSHHATSPCYELRNTDKALDGPAM